MSTVHRNELLRGVNPCGLYIYNPVLYETCPQTTYRGVVHVIRTRTHTLYSTMQVESGSIHKRIPHIHRWFPEPPIDNGNSLNNDMDSDQFSWSLIQHTVRLSNAEEKQSGGKFEYPTSDDNQWFLSDSSRRVLQTMSRLLCDEKIFRTVSYFLNFTQPPHNHRHTGDSPSYIKIRNTGKLMNPYISCFKYTLKEKKGEREREREREGGEGRESCIRLFGV